MAILNTRHLKNKALKELRDYVLKNRNVFNSVEMFVPKSLASLSLGDFEDWIDEMYDYTYNLQYPQLEEFKKKLKIFKGLQTESMIQTIIKNGKTNSRKAEEDKSQIEQ